VSRILNLIDQLTGKTIRAPSSTVLPMTKEQDADWKLYHSRRLAAPADGTNTAFEARGGKEQRNV